MAEHQIDQALLDGRPVKVQVVGCGGTGSVVAGWLPYLHQSMLAWGHRGGLDVELIDGDEVTETNCVRQGFSRADVGRNKAEVLVERINYFFGLSWTAKPAHVRDGWFLNGPLVIGCVDTRRARAAIGAASGHARYWLDLGNNDWDGQFVLGQPERSGSTGRNAAVSGRLPTVVELFPDTVDASKDDDTPACSAVEALSRQGPFVNQTIASHAMALLARLFRFGRISHHGEMINLATGVAAPLPVWPHLASRRKGPLLGVTPGAAAIRCDLDTEALRLRCPAGCQIEPGEVYWVATGVSGCEYRVDRVIPAPLGVPYATAFLSRTTEAERLPRSARPKAPARRRAGLPT